ncbi:hypothetical protein O3M35_001250 [Rhynocoris fuscipes]|uniref:Uncharacterized protein n=1 Tax=Rhynocoris fuscipes TaxID=488301 RepID=A0AAW1DRJ1_9HEMI
MQEERAKGRARGRARGRSLDTPPEGLPTARSSAPEAKGAGGAGARSAGTPSKRLVNVTRDIQELKISRGGRGEAPTRGNFRGRKATATEAINTRPKKLISKQGTSGTPVTLTANYFKLVNHTDWALYQYRVDFSPEEDRTVKRKALLKIHKDVLGGYVFDGTVLFVSNRLCPEPLELFSKRESDDEKIRITIKKAGDLVMGDHHYIQLFNILMRKCLCNLQLQMVGRNYFDASARVEVREYKMELWPGYLTSIRQHESSILMCAEITHKVMRRDTALDLIHDMKTRHRNADWKTAFTNAIIGSIVLTEHNNRTYRIDDVDFDVRPNSKFKLRNSEEISYVDYYVKKYDIRVRNLDQPMLVSRAKPREIRAGMTENIFLVPELCRLTGLTDDMRSNFQLMRALAEHTRVVPQARIDKLNKFSQRLRSTPSVLEDLTMWNMKLSENLVQFTGRILPQERISYGGGKYVEAGPEADWTKSLRNNAMLIMGKLKVWAVIYLSKSKADVHSFLASLSKSAQSMNFTIPPPHMREIHEERCGAYVEALDEVISHLSPQLIMCIVPNNRSDRYAAIKKKCCVDRAVPTQVVLSKNLVSKGIMSIATKIAVQINCKIGGTPWTVNIPLSGLMVVGYDVCHDTTNKGRSFGAMVASLNKNLSRYYSSATPHTSGEELSNDLSINIVKAALKYKKYNEENKLPSSIVIFRDGVGEGQIPFVYNHEVRLIKEKLADLYKGQPPKLAFVIVTKRLNTRIFYQNKNPPPGTVADDCITSPDKYDFFLVSQSVRQGTVSPTSYNIIDDSTGLDPDKMQRLTYKMTHLYFNWSGTVRVPAQCQYAHKLAFLVGQSLHKSPDTSLEELLYFL